MMAFIEKSIKQKFLNNLKNPLAGPIRFELQPQGESYDFWGHYFTLT